MMKDIKPLWVLKSYPFRLAFFAWMVLITVLSLVTFPDDPGQSMDFHISDKAVHFVFYFIAAALCVFYLREKTSGTLKLYKAALYGLLVAVVYGIIIEVIQGTLTTERSGEINDVLANCIGGIAGILFVRLLFSSKTGLKWKD